MLCGAATGLDEMVAFRVLQGIFAAFINPLSQTVMLDINPPRTQAKAMSIWGMGIMVGPIMGPVIGGWLTDNYNWRWVLLHQPADRDRAASRSCGRCCPRGR